MVISCVSYGCSSEQGRRKKSFHTFPFKRPEILTLWIQAVGRDKRWTPSKNSRLCGDHFLPTDYIVQPGLKRLKPDAVPSVFCFPKHVEPKVISNASTVVEPQNNDLENQLNIHNTTLIQGIDSQGNGRTIQPHLVLVQGPNINGLSARHYKEIIIDSSVPVQIGDEITRTSLIEATQCRDENGQELRKIICADGIVSEVFDDKIVENRPDNSDREEDLCERRKELCFDDFEEADMEDETKAKLFWKVAHTTVKNQNKIYRYRLQKQREKIEKLKAALKNRNRRQRDRLLAEV